MCSIRFLKWYVLKVEGNTGFIATCIKKIVTCGYKIRNLDTDVQYNTTVLFYRAKS